MSTFEADDGHQETVNALSHYTDWTIGHVGSRCAGWVANESPLVRCITDPRVWRGEM